MLPNDEALGCAADAGIPRAGVCAFSPDLLLAQVRSAARLPQAARSILVCVFPYSVGIPKERNLSLYAMLRDYHAVAGAMLQDACARLSARFLGQSFVPFVDSSPIDEVTAAVRAGLGLRGKNGLLLTPAYGSLVFLGEIVTDLPLAGAREEQDCDGCGRCVAACPTGALSAGGLNPLLCRSQITQKKGMLTSWEEEQVAQGGLAWGCDLCLLACPHNRAARPTPIAAFLADVTPVVTFDNLDALLANRAFAWRGRAVLARNLRLLEERRSTEGKCFRSLKF